MYFDWHAQKSAACLRERGFDFGYAARVFEGAGLERVDDRRDYGEVRIQRLGEIDGTLFHVVYTDRLDQGGDSGRWIISARRAHEKDRRRWRSER